MPLPSTPTQSPVATSPAAAPTTATRQDLLALGRAGKPREFLPIAVRALEQIPADLDLRFLLAANCAQLGLRTIAAETLDRLPVAAQADPNVKALAAAVENLPDDRVTGEERRAFAEANLAALRARKLPAAEVLDAIWQSWLDRLDTHDCFRTTEGNLVRRSAADDLPAWTHFLTDNRSIAVQFCEQRLGDGGVFPQPLTIEGLDPPWLFETAWRTLAPNRVGYAAPITLLQADPLAFLDGLSVCDLRELLGDNRVRVFVGANASSRWLDDVMGRMEEASLGKAIVTPGTRSRISPDAQAVTNRWSAAQAEALREAQNRIAALYAPRDRAWWKRRYDEATTGGPPLRVLIPTSRYSTYIRHAAEDLAEAMRGLGCDARVAIEAPDSRPTSLGQLRWADPFEPDLIVLANYFRHDAGLPFPEQVPWVCWLQDAMEHQFAEREFNDLDFIVGHLHREIRTREGFPRDRAMPFPVVASARKFHPAPASGALLERFACEVAYVSHQSETPQSFHTRCLTEERNARHAGLLAELRPLIEKEAAEPLGTSLHNRLDALTKDAALATADGTDGLAEYVFRYYALPLADRVLRQQTLGWAVDICERRGWRLRVFGRGWEDHPRFAPSAFGEIEHGEDLRACYQAATIHLHTSVNTLVHQRVMECALSGGLPIGRLTTDTVDESLGAAQREAVLHHTPCNTDPATGDRFYRVADCPALANNIQLREWLGLKSPDTQRVTAAQFISFRRPDHPLVGGMHAAWLFGDLRELTVRTEEDLERIIERAVEEPAWREAQSAGIAARVRERCSTEAFAAQMIELVRKSLETSPIPTETARA